MSIPFIDNVYLKPLSNSSFNIKIRLNSSCEQCLCESLISNDSDTFIAMNCLSNNTCQFFDNFPLRYKLESSSTSRLYFLKNQFPNASQCCMSNITELLNLLKNSVPYEMLLPFAPGAFGYDENNPSEVAVSGFGVGFLYWFNPITMTRIRNFSINASYFLTVYNNQTFVSSNNIPLIHIRDRETNSYLGNINYSSLNSIRKFLFFNNGQTVAVSTQQNLSITMFNVNSPTNFTLQREIPSAMPSVHGIAKINDTHLYASSWANRSIVSYKYENSVWTNKIFVNTAPTSYGSFLAVDDCERVWFINTDFGLRIYDSSGIEIGNWNMSLNSKSAIYDLLFLPNYVLFISNYKQNKTIRYDPQITCS